MDDWEDNEPPDDFGIEPELVNTLTCNRCNKEAFDCTCPDINERLTNVRSGYAGELAREVLMARIKRDSKIAPEPEGN